MATKLTTKDGESVTVFDSRGRVFLEIRTEEEGQEFTQIDLSWEQATLLGEAISRHALITALGGVKSEDRSMDDYSAFHAETGQW